MTKEPDYNAHAKCSWCHCLRPVSETINWDGVTLCRDGDCLPNMRRATDVSRFRPDDWLDSPDWPGLD